MNYQRNLGRIPTINELSEYLEIPTEDIILAQEASRTPSSIHETVYENDGDPITLLDQIDDGNEGKWFDKIALKEAIQRIRRTGKINCLFAVL